MAEDVARQSSLGEGVPFCKQVASLRRLIDIAFAAIGPTKLARCELLTLTWRLGLT